MKIIISPAKKMEECSDIFEAGQLPAKTERTAVLLRRLKAMDEGELKALFKASDSITHENYLRFQAMDLGRALTPALLAYVGIQYQYMAPKLFSMAQWAYVKRNLRILSGFYGILKAGDRVTPYRLEMQAKLETEASKDLYGFWGPSLYESLAAEERRDYPGKRGFILNLASKEYSKAVEPYVEPDMDFVTCVFGTNQGGKLLVKATEAKMARGEMVRFLAEKGAEDLETVKGFSGLGYTFDEGASDGKTLVFRKNQRA